MVDIKSADEIALMRESGRIAYRIMGEIGQRVAPGVTTAQLDAVFMKYVEMFHVKASFKNYRGYPAGICTSVNDEIVHGIPGKRVLNEGDIVSIDLGVVKSGYNSDMARTFRVGVVSEEANHIIATARECFFAGIAQFTPENRLYDICGAIEDCAKKNGASVPRELVGHGIGRNLHEDPDVPNYRPTGHGMRLKPGLVICIEPMVCLGAEKVAWDKNGWTCRTADGALSAHYENMVALTQEGAVILTAE